MVDNSQKIWLGGSLNKLASKKAADAIRQMGRALPCSVISVMGSIVTVRFEVNATPFTLPQVTIPVFGPEYIRYPIQAGCKGVVFPADVYIGNVTGLGGGTPDFSTPGNLSALVFFPVGNKNFSTTDDPNALLLYGPDGVILRDLNKKTVITLTAGGVVIALQAGDAVTINGNLIVNGLSTMNGNLQLSGSIETIGGGTYTGDLKTAGDMIAGFGGGDQVGLQTHTHTQADDSHGDTEQPTSAPTAGT